MSNLMILFSGDEKIFTPTDSPVIVGRADNSDVQILEPNVSRSHLRVTFGGGAWLIEDISSTGTFETTGLRGSSWKLSNSTTLILSEINGPVLKFKPAERVRQTQTEPASLQPRTVAKLLDFSPDLSKQQAEPSDLPVNTASNLATEPKSVKKITLTSTTPAISPTNSAPTSPPPGDPTGQLKISSEAIKQAQQNYESQTYKPKPQVGVTVVVDGQQVKFDTGAEFTIGRDINANVQLQDTASNSIVSRIHMLVKYQNGAWTVRDLSSRGTFHQGREIPEILIARHSLELLMGDPKLGIPVTIEID